MTVSNNPPYLFFKGFVHNCLVQFPRLPGDRELALSDYATRKKSVQMKIWIKSETSPIH